MCVQAMTTGGKSWNEGHSLIFLHAFFVRKEAVGKRIIECPFVFDQTTESCTFRKPMSGFA